MFHLWLGGSHKSLVSKLNSSLMMSSLFPSGVDVMWHESTALVCRRSSSRFIRFFPARRPPWFGGGSTVNHFSGTGYLAPQRCDVSELDNIHSRGRAKQRRQCASTRALSLSKRLGGSAAMSSPRWTGAPHEWELFEQHAVLGRMRPVQAAGHFNWPFSTPRTLRPLRTAGGEEEGHLLPQIATQRLKETRRATERQGVPLRWRWWVSGSQHVSEEAAEGAPPPTTWPTAPLARSLHLHREYFTHQPCCDRSTPETLNVQLPEKYNLQPNNTSDLLIMIFYQRDGCVIVQSFSQTSNHNTVCSSC